MQISISKFMGVVTGIVILGLIAAFGYFVYTVFFTASVTTAAPSLDNINTNVLGPKAQKAASVLVNAHDRISLKKKDLSYTESKLFNSFTEVPGSVPLSESRGRPDPFVPYVAP